MEPSLEFLVSKELDRLQWEWYEAYKRQRELLAQINHLYRNWEFAEGFLSQQLLTNKED
jgi:hypothetical protein